MIKRFISWFRNNDEDNESSSSVEDHQVSLSTNKRSENSVSNQPIPWQKIAEGTQNMDSSYIIGRGTFGKVYRCELRKIEVVAAKIQQISILTDRIEFEAEITALKNSYHPNIVKLIGVCEEADTRTLVYEFVPRGSLNDYLRANSLQSSILDWTKRMNIALGIAEALVYCHDNLNIIHRNVNASDVLLDNEFEPKLADFGLAIKISVGQDNFEIPNTVNRRMGNRGYSAPEIVLQNQATTKSDVYSFGVLLLYLFTGREPDVVADDPYMMLPHWFMLRAWGKEEFERRIIDERLNDVYSFEALKEIFDIAHRCINQDEESRPIMSEVRLILHKASRYQARKNLPVRPKLV